MSRMSDRLGLALPLYIQFTPEAIKVIDRLGVTATYIPIANDPERRLQTGRVSREQGAEIANAIVQALTDEIL